MSPKEFYYALKAKSEDTSRKIEFEFRKDYEVARFHAMLVINPTLGKGKQIKSPKELVSFAWEKEEVHVQSVEDMKAMLMGIAKRGNKKRR